MIVLLAAGVGVCVVGLLAIGFGIPISDTSFGNALLIAGVVILCTGVVLLGMWFVARELSNAAKLVAAQLGAAPGPIAASRPAAPANPFAAAVGGPVADDGADHAGASASPPPWADEIASRGKPRPSTPEIPPIEPVEAPLPPVSNRPQRRNLLFATKRRDKAELEPTPPLPTPALEAQPKVSFENAWPNPSRTNGGWDRGGPSNEPADAANHEADADHSTAAPDEPPPPAEAAAQDVSDLPPGVTVVRSGTVDDMAYTYYSDGSIEAQLAGESPIRFASLDALRTYVEQRK
jgi:hypothetical protein